MGAARTTCLEDILLSQTHCCLFVPLWPTAIALLIALLAETNRAPFDLPEAEAELVAGYNVEYSSLPFALFFLSEYSGLLSMSMFACILVCGHSSMSIIAPLLGLACAVSSMALLASTLVLIATIARASFPRYRYDHLLALG